MTSDVSNPRSKRLVEFDIVRGFAVLLVVFYHAAIALPVAGLPVPGWADLINRAIAPQRMPLLVFLSGMLLPRSLAKPPGRYLGGKLRQVAWPWLVWTLLTVSLLVVGSAAFGDGNFLGVRAALLVMVDARTYTWYLAYLMVYYVLALIIPVQIRPWLIAPLWVVCALANDVEGWSLFTSLLACFLTGEWFARHDLARKVISRRWVQIAAGVLLATITVAAVYGLPVRYTIWSLFGLVGAVIVLLPVARAAQHGLAGRWLAGVGRESIVYYLTHWPVITVLVHLLARSGLASASLALAALVGLSLAVCLLAVRLRERSQLVGWLYAWPAARARPVAVGSPR